MTGKKPWPAGKRPKLVAEPVSTTAISLRKLKADAALKTEPAVLAGMSKTTQELFAEISAFQSTRQDLPQAHFLKLSKGDQKKVSNAYHTEQSRPMLEQIASPRERSKMEKAIRTNKITIRTKKPRP
jgi:hypothetical protein